MQPNVRQKIITFFAQYSLKFYDKDEIMIYGDEDPTGIFYIVSGQVRQYDISPSGEEMVLNVFQQPSIFPLSWAINQTPNKYFYSTYTDSAIRTAPADETLRFILNNPDVAYDLMKEIVAGIEVLQKRTSLLMGGCSQSRVMFELLINCKRFGIRQSDGSCLLNIHEGELAHRAGLTRETVSRELVKLERQHILDVKHSNMVIQDAGQLEYQLANTGLGISATDLPK